MHEDGKLITAEEAMCRIGKAAGQLKDYVDTNTESNVGKLESMIYSKANKADLDAKQDKLTLPLSVVSGGTGVASIDELKAALGMTKEVQDYLEWVSGVEKDVNVYLYDGDTLYFTHNTVTDHKGHTLTASYVLKPTNYISKSPWDAYASSITKIRSDRIVAPRGLDYFFKNCNIVDVSTLANWNTHAVTSMFSLFSGCSSLTNVDGLANWDTSAVTSMYDIFGNCKNVASFTSLDSWDVSNVTSHSYAFDNTTGTRPSWGTSW